MRPLATGLVKSAISKALEAAIRAALEQADQQISDIKERIDDANQEEGTNKIDALKAHFNDKKQRAEATKQKAQEKARESLFLTFPSTPLSPLEMPSPARFVNWDTILTEPLLPSFLFLPFRPPSSSRPRHATLPSPFMMNLYSPSSLPVAVSRRRRLQLYFLTTSLLLLPLLQPTASSSSPPTRRTSS